MTRRTIEIAAFLAALLVAALAFNAWLASHDEQQRLQSTLAAQKQIIGAADARERARDAALSQTLAQIEKLKRTSQTPEQIVRDLPNYLPLPQPITLVRNSPTNSSEESSHDSWQSPANPGNSIAPGVAASASATSPGTLSLPGSAAGADIKLADQPRCKKASEFRNAQSICQADKNTVPEVLRPNLGPESALEAPAKKSVVDESGARTSLDAARASAKNSATSNAIQAASPNSPSEPPSPTQPCADAADCTAQIPAADLKPLYNYIQDCRACQTKLATANQNAADDAKKIAALTQERNAAITAAKGGTFWRRLRRNATWFAAGAVLGCVASRRR
jgi:hypothetical protein